LREELRLMEESTHQARQLGQHEATQQLEQTVIADLRTHIDSLTHTLTHTQAHTPAELVHTQRTHTQLLTHIASKLSDVCVQLKSATRGDDGDGDDDGGDECVQCVHQLVNTLQTLGSAQTHADTHTDTHTDTDSTHAQLQHLFDVCLHTLSSRLAQVTHTHGELQARLTALHEDMATQLACLHTHTDADADADADSNNTDVSVQTHTQTHTHTPAKQHPTPTRTHTPATHTDVVCVWEQQLADMQSWMHAQLLLTQSHTQSHTQRKARGADEEETVDAHTRLVIMSEDNDASMIAHTQTDTQVDTHPSKESASSS
jgi:hypothetical protein